MLRIAAAAMPSGLATSFDLVVPAKSRPRTRSGAGIQGPATRMAPAVAGPAGIPEVR